MKHLFSILLTVMLCATASAQTIRTMGFNTTNGEVIANSTNTLVFTNSNITFQNSVVFSDDVSAPAFDASGATNGVRVEQDQIVFSGTSSAATRTNLALTLPALTNTSNVTMMRALAGSTNTNQPFSGAVELSDGTISWLLTFSNGILVKLEGL